MSDNATESLLLCLLLEEEDDDDFLLLYARKKRNAPDLLFKSRTKEGSYSILIKNHLIGAEEKFRKYCRINKNQFDFVLSLIVEEIQPKNRHAITAEEKLYLTLRFLATGETFESLSTSFRISVSYISRLVKRVLNVMREKLVPILMKTPTRDDFKCIEQIFWQKWNIPNCIGGIDGKHVRVRAPKNSGSLFFNYKDYFSIVLLAIVDANCKFVAVDVGAYGKESDNGIFQKSTMGKQIATNRFNIPPPKLLQGSDVMSPHFLIGDEAFALSHFMMKPYCRTQARLEREKLIYNYRLCRGRRVTENAFGLLSQVFRVFYTPIAIAPNVVDDLILTCCCLHNLLRDGYLERHSLPFHIYNATDRPEENMIDIVGSGGFANRDGFQIRENLKNFFCSADGAVSWQDSAVDDDGTQRRPRRKRPRRRATAFMLNSSHTQ
ncbi:hypothetical protein ABMA28_003537 [Loxostege sticticalis]|uniref:DDE Tnp4 domain-containing protein n=1 Tax=Loxostege sticticalis TaxID=481309 RepID=A0ABD0T0R8_LOXSC